MTSIKDEFITKMIKKEIQQRQIRKNMNKQINDIISTSKNSDSDEYSQLLDKIINRIKKKKRKTTKKVVTKDSSIELIKEQKYNRLIPYNLRKNNLKISEDSKNNNIALNTLKNSTKNMECNFLLQDQVKKKKKEKNSKIKKPTLQSQIDKLIASLSSDTVVKLIEMLQRDIRHSIRQIELLTGQKITIGSMRWSVERVCSAKLADIRMEEDLWAVYVRGFTKGYRSAEARSHFNSQQMEKQLEVKSNSTITANSSPLKFCQSSICMTGSSQENQSNASVLLPVPSIVRCEEPITCNEVVANPCTNQMQLLEPLEAMVLEPDLQAYFDTHMINDSSLQLYEKVAGEMPFSQSGVCEEFGTHMLCGGEGFACEVCREGEQAAAGRRRGQRRGEPRTCDRSGATSEGRDHLSQHRRRHAGVSAHACADCDKTFMYRNGLNRHRRARHGRPDDQAPFACDVCGKRFWSRGPLTAHYRLHAGVEARRRTEALPARRRPAARRASRVRGGRARDGVRSGPA